MHIQLTSLMVDDQTKALRFYTAVLGFVKKVEIPMGEFRWLTVASPEGHDDVQLSLEPNANPAAKAFQKAMFDQGIPLNSFTSHDLPAECARLEKRGVVFTKKPTRMGPVSIAVFSDTCGNLIQMHQVHAS
ncbi:MAG: VOC family protein [Planctomycetes bacterium]|nr:VOC family protein [Planctomycetota bacterium]